MTTEPGLATLPPPEIVHMDGGGRDAAQGMTVPYLPARSQAYRNRKNTRERSERATMRADGLDPNLRGVADIRKVLASAADPDTFELGEALWPARPNNAVGRPRDYPGWVFIVLGAGIEAWGSASAAITNLREPIVWAAVLAEARACAGDAAVDSMRRREPPELHHLNYLKRYFKDHPDAQRAFHDLFRRTAVGKAQEQGRLLPTPSFDIQRPNLDHYVYMDGVVVGSPTRTLTPTVEDPDTGEQLAVRYDTARGLFWQGGQGNAAAHGTAWVLSWNRTNRYGSRLLMDVRARTPDDGGEGRTIVSMFNDMCQLAPGIQGLLTDGILRHVHMKPIMDAGRLPIAPVAAYRKGESYRQAKDHALPDAAHGVKGKRCVHELVASDGHVWQRVDVNLAHPTLKQLEGKPMRRSNATGAKWYLEVTVPCRRGDFKALVPIAHDPAGEQPFNRLEYLRVVGPGSPAYKAAYPRRIDAEAGNREIKRKLPDDRLPAYGRDRQLLIMLFKAAAINSVSRWLFRNPAALRTGPPRTGQSSTAA